MRRIHRWFGLVTGLFMALIAITGISMQVIDLVSPEQHPSGPPPGMTTGATDSPGPQARDGQPPGPHGFELRPLLDHIHDGEVLGNTGRVVSLAMGVALLLFSISGIWMYWQMFKARKRIGKADVFW